MAAKQFEIAQITVNDKDLMDSLTKTKALIDELNKSQKKMRDAGDTSNETYIKQAAQLKTLNKEYGDNIKVLQSTTNATENLNSSLAKENRSVDEAIKNNKELRAIRNQLDTTTKEGALAVEAINDKINENTEYINDNGSALEQLKNNVGNYTQSILNANPILGGMVTVLTAVKTALYGKKAAMDAGTKSTLLGSTALRTFAVALASTGIGLIVIALGAMIGYLTQTQSGLNKLNRALAPLKEIFAVLTGLIYDFGGKLIEAVSSPVESIKKLGNMIKENIINRFKAFGVMVKAFKEGDWEGVINGALQAGTGIEDLTHKVKEFASETGKAIDVAAKRGKRIEEIKQQLATSNAAYMASQEKLNLELEAEQSIAEDTTVSYEERNKAYEKARNILKKINKEKKERIDLEIEQLNLESQAKENSNEENDRIQERKNAALRANAEMIKDDRALMKKHNALNKTNDADIESNRKKIADKRLKDVEGSLEYELALYKEKARAFEQTDLEALQQAKDFHTRDINMLDKKLELKLISQQDYNLQKEKLDNDLRFKQLEFDKKELERIAEFDAKKKELEDELYLLGLKSDEEKAMVALEKKREDQLLALEDMKLEAEEKKELEDLINATYEAEKTILREEQAQREIEANQARLDALYEQEKASADARFGLAKRLFGMLSGLLGDSLAAQMASIAVQAALDIAKIKAAVATASAINMSHAVAAGFPANLVTIPAAATQNAALATSAGVSIAGVLANAALSAGQAGINSLKKNKNEGSYASSLPFRDGTIVSTNNPNPNQGGIAGTESNAANGIINYDLLANKMAQANMSLPSPVVSVQEIDTVGKRVSVAESNASF